MVAVICCQPERGKTVKCAIVSKDTELCWYGEASEFGEAYDKYIEEASLQGEDYDDIVDASMLIELSDAELEEVKVWWESGALSNDYPTCLLTGWRRRDRELLEMDGA
jgi:hypothetical protein